MSETEDESVSSDSWPVNEDWLIEMLHHHHKTKANIEIKDFSAKQGCQDGVSNLSDIIAVVIHYTIDDERLNDGRNDENKLNIIIKLLPHDPFSRYFVTEAKFDLREIKFYTHILPDLIKFQEENIKTGHTKMPISVPKCFYTHYSPGNLPMDGSPEPPESILVLEDMRPHGYRPAHFTRGLTLDQTESAIKEISIIHALSLGLKIKSKINLNEKYPFLFQTNKATESYQQLVEQGLPHLIKFLENKKGYQCELLAINNLRAKTRSIIENLLQPVEPMGLITHTDFWCNNLLFKTNDNTCMILDWQMITYSQPTNDIALLIISSISSQIRRDCTHKLLDYYYHNLKENCLKINLDIEVELQYSRNKLECDYRKSQLLALLLCIGSVDVAIGNADAEQRLLDVLNDFYEDGLLNGDD